VGGFKKFLYCRFLLKYFSELELGFRRERVSEGSLEDIVGYVRGYVTRDGLKFVDREVGIKRAVE